MLISLGHHNVNLVVQRLSSFLAICFAPYHFRDLIKWITSFNPFCTYLCVTWWCVFTSSSSVQVLHPHVMMGSTHCSYDQMSFSCVSIVSSTNSRVVLEIFISWISIRSLHGALFLVGSFVGLLYCYYHLIHV